MRFNGQEKRWKLAGDTITPKIIGTDKASVYFHINKADFPGKDLTVSRKHCQISQDPQGFWVLTDLQSRNGTYIMCKPKEQELQDSGERMSMEIKGEMTVLIGDMRLKLCLIPHK